MTGDKATQARGQMNRAAGSAQMLMGKPLTRYEALLLTSPSSRFCLRWRWASLLAFCSLVAEIRADRAATTDARSRRHCNSRLITARCWCRKRLAAGHGYLDTNRLVPVASSDRGLVPSRGPPPPFCHRRIRGLLMAPATLRVCQTFSTAADCHSDRRRLSPEERR